MPTKKVTSNATTSPTPPPAPRRRAKAAPKNGELTALSAMKTANDASVVTAGEPTREQIAEAAYLRYLQRGGSDGQDFNDWLEAERELRNRR